MKTSVTVTANPKTGAIFTQNAKPGKDGQSYGFLRVQQTVVEFKGALASVRQRSALAPFKSSDFAKVKDFYKHGTVLEGNIIRKESFEPEYEGQPSKQVPRFDINRKPLLNEDGTPKMRDVTSNGQKIWSKDIFISDLEAKDELCLPYDKYEETELAPEELEIAGNATTGAIG